MKGRKTILWKQNSPFNSLLIYWNIGWPKLYLYNFKDCQDEIKIKVHFRPILNIVYTWCHVWCIICCFKNSTLYIPTAEQTGVIWVVFQRHTNVSFNKEEILIVGRSEHYFQAVVEKLVAILETSHTGVAQAVQVTSVIGPRKEQYKISRNEQKKNSYYVWHYDDKLNVRLRILYSVK